MNKIEKWLERQFDRAQVLAKNLLTALARTPELQNFYSYMTTEPQKEQTAREAENTEAATEQEVPQQKEGTAAEAEELTPEDEVDKAKQELGEMKNKYLRLYADFENYRKRSAKEKLDTIKTASGIVIKELLPVLDDFDRAQATAESESFGDEAKQYKEGIDLIRQKLQKTLEKNGLVEMADLKGTDFDPEFHEAVTQYPGEPEMKGKIVDVVEKGFMMEDKVIRYAKVVTGA